VRDGAGWCSSVFDEFPFNRRLRGVMVNWFFFGWFLELKPDFSCSSFPNRSGDGEGDGGTQLDALGWYITIG